MQTIEPTVTDAGEARLLGVPPYPPALLFARTTRYDSNRVDEFTRPVCRGDRYRITTHLPISPKPGRP